MLRVTGTRSGEPADTPVLTLEFTYGAVRVDGEWLRRGESRAVATPYGPAHQGEWFYVSERLRVTNHGFLEPDVEFSEDLFCA